MTLHLDMATHSHSVTPLSRERLSRAKIAFTARRVPQDSLRCLLSGSLSPRPGDLVLARVVQIGQHQRLHLRDARRARLFPGDEIVVAFGDRYAPNQFESYVPADLGRCSLVAAGGLASEVRSKCTSVKEPTVIEPIGLPATAAGARLNLADHGLARRAPAGERPPVLAVVGTSMDSGKTTTVAGLAHGLSHAGKRVAAIKVTGTGSPNDLMHYGDAGAAITLDFTDAGHATTFGVACEELVGVLEALLAESIDGGADVILVEVADGLYLEDTAALVRHPRFRELTDGLLFAGCDSMGAVAGARLLAEWGLPVVGLSGRFTASELGMREARAAQPLPVYGLPDLWTPETVLGMLQPTGRERVVG